MSRPNPNPIPGTFTACQAQCRDELLSVRRRPGVFVRAANAA